MTERYDSGADGFRRAPTRLERLARLRRIAGLLDARFGIPGTPLRFGLDSLVGLIPGVGDVSTGLVSAYIVLEAYRMGVSRRTLVRMARNVAIDVTVGAVPALGDAFDLFWKANLKNIDLIERDLARQMRN
ncbi:DUF4112 domain-containing protein [Oceanibaculum pacificum]|uniref:DUF4112 domain-containing protein n=1 Tax=Oceanibaculum pacificum TaxID=580166 RepID=A0A154W4H3_9PROT|nr:DUF4112 domain-containing protein [Oceanibaculum pacificum]KZD08351.1 hypothetical protein AUP43_01760 [Oceanibaculum pacificum]